MGHIRTCGHIGNVYPIFLMGIYNLYALNPTDCAIVLKVSSINRLAWIAVMSTQTHQRAG